MEYKGRKLSLFHRLCILFMPDFYDKLPVFKHGVSFQGAWGMCTSELGLEMSVCYGKVWNDNHSSYLEARINALFLDWSTRLSHPDCGVFYVINDNV